MILLDFIQAECTDDAPERHVKVQLDWIGCLREHDLFGTVIELAHVGPVWVKESMADVEANMLAEYYKRQNAVNANAWQQNGAVRR